MPCTSTAIRGRDSQAADVSRLLAPYREWPWYSEPKPSGEAMWSEPFIDEGGGNMPMLTYSVPLERQGQFVGVVTVDLSLDYFQVLQGWLDELHWGGRVRLCGQRHRNLHQSPNPACKLPRKITDFSQFQEDESLARCCSGCWEKGGPGRGRRSVDRPAIGVPFRPGFVGRLVAGGGDRRVGRAAGTDVPGTGSRSRETSGVFALGPEFSRIRLLRLSHFGERWA